MEQAPQSQANLAPVQRPAHQISTLFTCPSAALHFLKNSKAEIVRTGVLRLVYQTMPNDAPSQTFLWVSNYCLPLNPSWTVVTSTYDTSVSYLLVLNQALIHCITVPKDSSVCLNLDGFFRIFCFKVTLQQAFAIPELDRTIKNCCPWIAQRPVYPFDFINSKVIQKVALAEEKLLEYGLSARRKCSNIGTYLSSNVDTIQDFRVPATIKKGGELAQKGAGLASEYATKAVSFVVNPLIGLLKLGNSTISQKIDKSNSIPLKQIKNRLSIANQVLLNTYEGISNLVGNVGLGLLQGGTTVIHKKFGKPQTDKYQQTVQLDIEKKSDVDLDFPSEMPNESKTHNKPSKKSSYKQMDDN